MHLVFCSSKLLSYCNTKALIYLNYKLDLHQFLPRHWFRRPRDRRPIHANHHSPLAIWGGCKRIRIG